MITESECKKTTYLVEYGKKAVSFERLDTAESFYSEKKLMGYDVALYKKECIEVVTKVKWNY